MNLYKENCTFNLLKFETCLIFKQIQILKSFKANFNHIPFIEFSDMKNKKIPRPIFKKIYILFAILHWLCQHNIVFCTISQAAIH